MHLLSVFSLRNRALNALLTLVVGGFGAFALTTLKQDLFPNLNIPQLVLGGLAVATLAVMTELAFALLERGVRRSVGTVA